MTALPILLSIPHGGTQKPIELDGHLSITNKDLFDDSDPFVIELFDLGDKVQRVIKTTIARAFVDLNRALDDMAPKNPDGLIKSKTCYDKPIYTDGKEPDDSLKTMLVELYYHPYHRTIQQSMNDLDLKLCIDCHSMAATPPYFSRAKSKSPRPMFCISNNDGKAASQEMMEMLADSISEGYSIDRQEIFLNDPFHGGHITRTYGNNPLPWIQIEMNRKMYLSEEWFNKENLSIDTSRLQELNKMFENSLILFANKLG
ncbi:MAG: N-formylglutamate amidohydrolase [Thaumarchaeota archaeon]|nr:N-formylglutamate amidohydrolase [Nitrososphaerota archaeon]